MERRQTNAPAIACLLAPIVLLLAYVAGYYGMCGEGEITQGGAKIGVIRHYRPWLAPIYEPAGAVEEWLTGHSVLVVGIDL